MFQDQKESLIDVDQKLQNPHFGDLCDALHIIPLHIMDWYLKTHLEKYEALN